MAQNQQPKKSAAGANVSKFGTEFASETNAQKVRQQNAQSASGATAGTEFASATDAQQVRQQNQQAEANKGQNS